MIAIRTNALIVTAAVHFGSVIGAGRFDEADSFVRASGEARSAVRTSHAASHIRHPSECDKPKPAWIWCDDFEADRLARYFEYARASGRFVRAKGAGIDGSYGMRAQFAAGRTGAGFLHLAFGKTPHRYFRPVDKGTAVYRNIYWRVFVRYDVGWVGGSGSKMSRATSFASPASWAQAMVVHVWSGRTKPAHLSIDPASGTDSSGALRTSSYNDAQRFRWLGSRSSTTPIVHVGNAGQWRCIEAHAKLNDPGAANGLVELWIDDRLEARRHRMNFVGVFTEYGINAVFLENYWDGGAPAQQSRYFDNFIVSSERIRC